MKFTVKIQKVKEQRPQEIEGMHDTIHYLAISLPITEKFFQNFNREEQNRIIFYSGSELQKKRSCQLKILSGYFAINTEDRG